jgi:hypothetical protein
VADPSDILQTGTHVGDKRTKAPNPALEAELKKKISIEQDDESDELESDQDLLAQDGLEHDDNIVKKNIKNGKANGDLVKEAHTGYAR